MEFKELWEKEKGPWVSTEYYSAEKIAEYFYLTGVAEEREKFKECLERIGNVLSTVKVTEQNIEDESDLAESQSALFDIAIITETFAAAIRQRGE